ncbi:MAG: 6-bladed beta-propeller [Promethearchaeota archaeon]
MKLSVFIVIVFISIKILFAQDITNIDTNNEIFIKSRNSSSEVKKFIRVNTQFRVIDKKAYLDTIQFEHRGRYFFQNAPPFVILSDGNYVIGYEGNVGDKSALYLYNKDGKFLKKVARYGQGPGEVSGSMTLCKDKNNFYVSDGIQRKILIFTNNGKYVREVWQSTHWGYQAFKVSSVSDRYFYYHIFPSRKAKLFTMGNLKNGIIKEFGELSKANKIAMHSRISGIVFNEAGYLFVIKPAEYGFEIFDDNGNYIGKRTGKRPGFFKEIPGKVVKRIDKDHIYSLEVFFNNTRAQSIFYLGENILIILYYRNYLKNGKKITWKYLLSNNGKDLPELKFITHIEFWKTDGEYLGCCQLKGKFPGVSYAEEGYLYFWYQKDSMQGDYYPNPLLIRYDLWKKLGWRQ